MWDRYIVLISTLAFCRPEDYWIEVFDEDKNCQSEEIMKQLEEENKFETHCSINYKIDPNEAIIDCKQDLAERLLHGCRDTRVTKGGDLIYCRSAEKTTCCFTHYKCDSMNSVSKNMFKNAENFLKNKKALLEDYRRRYGYKTCHAIKGYDATKCARDCRKLKNTPLAKECARRKGMLKCCIRRDKVNCDECRFCCTLPFCTFMSTHRDLTQLVESDVPGYKNKRFKDDASKLRGIDFIHSRNLFYQGSDTRCLKPWSHKNPHMWRHYWPDDFAYALSKRQLDGARSTEFDVRFFNFEDPVVFKKMTGKHYAKHFKETFGFDFVAKVGKHNAKKNIRTDVKCTKSCLMAEQSKFAKHCRKHKGFFKCCINTLDVSPYEWIRLKLKRSKLIRSARNICGTRGHETGNCQFCTATFLCTKYNRLTGTVWQSYKSKKFNPLGGVVIKNNTNFVRVPFKASFCDKQDYCQMKSEAMDISMFLNARYQQDMCRITSSAEDRKNGQDDLSEGLDECKKRQSNIRICPRKLLQDGNSPLARINAVLGRLRSERNKKQGRKIKPKTKKKGNKQT